MPYIKTGERRLLNPAIYILNEEIQKLAREDAGKTAGHLNYAISRLIALHRESLQMNYAEYNELIGVLECAKMELYRRHIAPYENTKMAENGDV